MLNANAYAKSESCMQEMQEMTTLHSLALDLYFVYLSTEEFIGQVHIAPEKYENAALLLPLGLPSTIIRHQNGAFRKRSSSRRNLKTLALRLLKCAGRKT